MSLTFTDLLSLDKDTLEPPESRVKDIEGIRSRIKELKDGDDVRSNKRAIYQALIDGEPPYDEDEMENCGRGDDANINFRGAEGRVAAAQMPYYELDFGVPTALSLEIEYGEEKNKQKLFEWAQKIAERITKLLWGWSGYKLKKRMSHYQMVVYGHGPVMWPRKRGWHFEAKSDDHVWVADNAHCDLDELEEMVVPGHFNPVQLWKMVENAPKDSGWNIKMAKQAIIAAAPKTFKDAHRHSWGQYEASLRRGDTLWNNKAARIYYADYFVKEFSGKITHCIVLESTPDDPKKQRDKDVVDDFVFKKVGWFDSFHQIICPFHFDVGPDENWWSVKGLGPKIYSGSDLENRFLCTLVNNAMSSSGMVMQAKNGQALQTIQQTPVVRSSGVSFVPNDWDVIPNATGNLRLDGPLEVIKTVTNLMDSNTGQFDQIDNPPQPTLGQQQIQEKGQAELTRGQYDWYYAFADDFLKEMVRRILDPNLNEKDSGGKEALEMRKKLVDEDEVPEECLKYENISNIRATRSIGYGSPQMQHIVSGQLVQLMGTMTEEGRQNALRMNGATLVGQTNVDRFWPKFEEMGVPNDQEAWATFENNVLRMPIAQLDVTPNQNSVIHFQTHFKDALKHIQQVQQGQGDPASLIQHLDNVGPHNHEHLEKIKVDPTRKDLYKNFQKMHLQLAKATDQLKKQVQKKMQEQNGSGQQKPQIDLEQIGDLMKTQGEEKRKNAKLLMDESRKDKKMEADLQRKDKTAAAGIIRRNAETFS